MTSRIHILIDDEEKERFRRQAEREGKSLSAWLRDLARARLAESGAPELDSLEALRAFFAACDEREGEREPDWAEHLRVIAASRRSGSADT